ncbi:MAG TPA: hypothetical protein VF572_03015 [Candidatus Saccharimonadales bacterium]|jgi:type II secretory pathway pseudopilin PulG
MRSLPRDQRGITIVELVVVIMMTGLFTTIIMTYTIGYWRYGYMLEADLSTLTTRLNAGDFIRSGIGPSSGLITQNSIPDQHTAVPDPAFTSGYHWELVHAVPGNVPMPAKGAVTPLLYYQRPSAATNGEYIMNGTQPFEDEYIMYLDGTTKSLRQRSLANPNATGNKLQTSCPDNAVSPTCPADKTVASELASIDMRYFSRTGNLVDHTSITDPVTGAFIGPDMTAAEVVEFNLNIVKKTQLQTSNSISNSTIIRVALRND